MAKKITISEKRKKAIKKNYNKLVLNPPKRKNELAYFNKIKAGKKRYESVFRLSDGKISNYPEKFINDFIAPVAKSKGFTVREYLQFKTNRDEANKMFKTERLDWTYNEKTIEKFLLNIPKKTKLYIFTLKAKYQVSEIELRQYLSILKQTFIKINRVLLYWKVSIIEGFDKIIFWLPDAGEVIKLHAKKTRA